MPVPSGADKDAACRCTLLHLDVGHAIRQSTPEMQPARGKGLHAIWSEVTLQGSGHGIPTNSERTAKGSQLTRPAWRVSVS